MTDTQINNKEWPDMNSISSQTEAVFALAKMTQWLSRNEEDTNIQDETKAEAFTMRCNLLLKLNDTQAALGDARKAISLWDKVLDANPNHIHALKQRGSMLIVVGEKVRAEADARKLVEMDGQIHKIDGNFKL